MLSYGLGPPNASYALLLAIFHASVPWPCCSSCVSLSCGECMLGNSCCMWTILHVVCLLFCASCCCNISVSEHLHALVVTMVVHLCSCLCNSPKSPAKKHCCAVHLQTPGTGAVAAPLDTWPCNNSTCYQAFYLAMLKLQSLHAHAASWL